MAYIAAHGMTVAAEFVEVESGKRDDRPQLVAALAACRLHRARLVIAKLDRLARNVAFIANLMDGAVDFVACDMPYANRLTLHLMAAMAEHEREMISQRTKAALAAAKARGVRLGNPRGASHLLNGCRDAAAASVAVRRGKAREHLCAISQLVRQLQHQGVCGVRAIARELNKRGVPSPRGGAWHPEQARRVLAMLDSSCL
jgi:DNA invertase Pin-like site-specific DNA recombinase